MKALCCLAAATGLLIAAPAMAQSNGSGSATSNIWSSAQGSSDSYGGAHGFATSSSGSIANALGRGTVGGGGSVGAGLTSAITTSTAAVVSPGSGYAQVQTSGYAGGSVSGFGGRAR